MSGDQENKPSGAAKEPMLKVLLKRLWKMIQWAFARWKLISLALIVIAFVSPPTYVYVIKRLPKAYYYVGVLKSRPGEQKYRNVVGLSRVDGAPHTERLAAFLETSGDTASLDAPNYIPAKPEPTHAASDILSRRWDGGSCLYVANPVIVPAYTDEDDNVLPAQGVDPTAHRRAFDQACSFDKQHKLCPAYALWLHGSPVPCSLTALVPRFLK